MSAVISQILCIAALGTLIAGLGFLYNGLRTNVTVPTVGVGTVPGAPALSATTLTGGAG